MNFPNDDPRHPRGTPHESKCVIMSCFQSIISFVQTISSLQVGPAGMGKQNVREQRGDVRESTFADSAAEHIMLTGDLNSTLWKQSVV